MDAWANLQRQRELWNKAKLSLRKEDVRFIGGKDSWPNKRLNLFTVGYFKRNKLIQNSDVVYGYVFKDYRDKDSSSAFHPVWVLFSPERFYAENPQEYAKVLQSMNASLATPHKGLKAKWEIAMTEAYPDASYLPVPPAFTEGRVVYLSIIYRRYSTMPSMRFGINLFLMNPVISKEILFLPPAYWTKEYGIEYRKEQ